MPVVALSTPSEFVMVAQFHGPQHGAEPARKNTILISLTFLCQTPEIVKCNTTEGERDHINLSHECDMIATRSRLASHSTREGSMINNRRKRG